MITGTLYLSSSESESSNSVKMPLDLMSGSKSAIELVTIVHREGMYMYGAMALWRSFQSYPKFRV